MRDNKVNPGLKPGKNDKAKHPKGNPGKKVGAMGSSAGPRKHQSDCGNWLSSCNMGVHGMKSPRPQATASDGASSR